MKKFILRFLLFFVLISFADYTYGRICYWLESGSNGGQSLKNHEIADVVTPDIAILGSSRSVHTYVPSIIEDSLHMDTYILGQDGNGIVMMYPLLKYVSNRHKPQIVVYDIATVFDTTDDDMHRYLPLLRHLWGRDENVDSVICAVDASERFKLLSWSYRYNSGLLSLLKGRFGNEKHWVKGYYSMSGKMMSTPKTSDHVIDYPETSDFKMRLFKEMSDFCMMQGVELLLVYSPSYNPMGKEAIKQINDIESATGLKVIDYSDLEFPGTRGDYFADVSHLNDKGSEIFTRVFASYLKNRSGNFR